MLKALLITVAGFAVLTATLVLLILRAAWRNPK